MEVSGVNIADNLNNYYCNYGVRNQRTRKAFKHAATVEKHVLSCRQGNGLGMLPGAQLIHRRIYSSSLYLSFGTEEEAILLH